MDVGLIIRAATSKSSEDHDSHHPEHAEQDADTASKNERDCAPLPGTQYHQCPMHAMKERAVELGATMAHGMTNVDDLRSLLGGYVVELRRNRSETDEWQGHRSMLFMLMLVVVVRGRSDEGKAKHLSELVSDGESLVLQATARVAANTLIGLRSWRGGYDWERAREPVDLADDWFSIDEADVGRHLFVRGDHNYSDRTGGSISHEASASE